MTESGRHRRHGYYHQFRRDQRQFRSRRQSGWGMDLYRNTEDGWIAGVCAGLADHWDVAHWVVRLLFVMLLLFSGTLGFWLYIGGWVLMARRPVLSNAARPDPVDEVEVEYDEQQHRYRPKKMFRYAEPSSVRLQRARERLDDALRRVAEMEAYVTSRQYNLNREINNL